MKFKQFEGDMIEIDFDAVDCYRGQTMPNGQEGTMIYFEDDTSVLIELKFLDVISAHRAFNAGVN